MGTHTQDSRLKDALHRLTVIEVARAHGLTLKVGVQSSPFRTDEKPSFSVLRGGQNWHDHAEGQGGSVWRFTERLLPEMSKRERAELLIRMAGLDGETAAAVVPSAGMVSAPACRGPKKFVHAERWPACVQARFEHFAGEITADDVAALAKRRGWLHDIVHLMVAHGVVSYPPLPWHDAGNEHGRRSWAFKVERLLMAKDGGLDRIPVGYHQQFERVERATGKVSKSWLFVPYVPADKENGRLSAFQQELQALQQRTVPYPFVLGNGRKPRVLVMHEGQWDAASHAMVCMKNGELPDGVWFIGLRGAQSVDATMECLTQYLREARPGVLLWPDNDKVGGTWLRKELGDGPAFRDRLLSAGADDVLVSTLCQRHGVKDCNDWVRKIGVERMREMPWMMTFYGVES